MPRDYRYVNPRELRLPSSRANGPDPSRLQRQISQFGSSLVGMPPIWVYEAADGALVIYNGVTRAMRIAILSPGTKVPIEVVGKLSRSMLSERSVGDLVP